MRVFSDELGVKHTRLQVGVSRIRPGSLMGFWSGLVLSVDLGRSGGVLRAGYTGECGFSTPRCRFGRFGWSLGQILQRRGDSQHPAVDSGVSAGFSSRSYGGLAILYAAL